MIPEIGGAIKDPLPDDALAVTRDQMRLFEVILDSITDAAMENPRSVGQSQVERIARGSRTDEEAVRKLLQQHKIMERTLKQFQGGMDGDMQRMMKKMQQGDGGMGGMGGMGGAM
jgi:signal recognition particle subunit SRP54